MVLKKEIVKTQNKDFEKGGDYRQMLVQVSFALLDCYTCGRKLVLCAVWKGGLRYDCYICGRTGE